MAMMMYNDVLNEASLFAFYCCTKLPVWKCGGGQHYKQTLNLFLFLKKKSHTDYE